MSKAYDRYLQQEAEEWFEEYDHDTTTGLLRDMTGEPLEDEDEDSEIFKMTGIY